MQKREKNNLSRGKIPAPLPLDIKWSVPYKGMKLNLKGQMTRFKRPF